MTCPDCDNPLIPKVWVAVLAPDGKTPLNWQVGKSHVGFDGYHPGEFKFTEEEAKYHAARLNKRDYGYDERTAYVVALMSMRPMTYHEMRSVELGQPIDIEVNPC